jgi:hypothetical protein
MDWTPTIASEFGAVDDPSRGGYTEANWNVGAWGDDIGSTEAKGFALPTSFLSNYGDPSSKDFKSLFNSKYDIEARSSDGRVARGPLMDKGPGVSTGASLDMLYGTARELGLPENYKGQVSYRVVPKDSKDDVALPPGGDFGFGGDIPTDYEGWQKLYFGESPQTQQKIKPEGVKPKQEIPVSPLAAIRSAYPNLRMLSDDQLSEQVRVKFFPGIPKDKFGTFFRSDSGYDDIRSYLDQELTPLQKIRQKWGGEIPKSMNDQELLHKLYDRFGKERPVETSVGKGTVPQSFDEFSERMNPKTGLDRAINNVINASKHDFMPALREQLRNDSASFADIESGEFDKSLFNALTAGNYGKLSEALDKWSDEHLGKWNVFKDLSDYLKWLAGAERAQAAHDQERISGSVAGVPGQVLGGLIGSAPGSAVTFGIGTQSEAGRAISLIGKVVPHSEEKSLIVWSSALAGMKGWGESEHERNKNSFVEGFKSSASAALAQKLFNSPYGMVGSGFLNVLLNSDSQELRDWMSGKPNQITRAGTETVFQWLLGLTFARGAVKAPQEAKPGLDLHEVRGFDVLGQETLGGEMPWFKPGPIAARPQYGVFTPATLKKAVEKLPEKATPEQLREKAAKMRPAEGRVVLAWSPEVQEELQKAVLWQKGGDLESGLKSLDRAVALLPKEDQEQLALDAHNAIKESATSDKGQKKVKKKIPEPGVDVPLMAQTKDTEAVLRAFADHNYFPPEFGKPKNGPPGNRGELGSTINPAEIFIDVVAFLDKWDVKLTRTLPEEILRAFSKTHIDPVAEKFADTFGIPRGEGGLASEAVIRGLKAAQGTAAKQKMAQALRETGVDKLIGGSSSRDLKAHFNIYSPSQQLELIHLFQTGSISEIKNPITRRIFEVFDTIFKAVEYIDHLNGINYNPRDYYFPHLIQGKKERERFLNALAAKFKWAEPGFIKPREFNDVFELAAAGYKLKTNNPAALVMMRLVASQEAYSKIRAMNQLRALGYASLVGVDKNTVKVRSEGWKPFHTADKNNWLVEPNAAAIAQNAWDYNSLYDHWSGPLWRALQFGKGLFVGPKLAWSFFHAIHILQIRAADIASYSQDRLLKGDRPLDALGRAITTVTGVRTLGDLPRLVREMRAKGVGAGLQDVQDMGTLIEFANHRIDWNQLTPQEQGIFRYSIEAGLNFEVSREREFEWAFQMADIPGRLAGMIGKGLPKNVDAGLYRIAHGADHAFNLAYGVASLAPVQRYTFGYVIPAIKAASFADRLDRLKHDRPELFNQDSNAINRKIELTKIGKDIDGRFGEMFYDNLFWRNTYKQAGILGLLSLGWKLSFFRIYGGALHDLTDNLSHMDKVLEEFKSKGSGAGFSKLLTNRITFALNYTMLMGLTNSMITYMFTGKPPDELEDLIFPVVGYDPQGRKKRLSTMFFAREFSGAYYHLKEEGLYQGGRHVIEGWMNPFLASVTQLIEGKDYMNRSIYSHDPLDPIQQKVIDGLTYLFTNSGQPIAYPMYTGGLPSTKIPGTNIPLTQHMPGWKPSDALMSMLGFNQAPKYTQRSDIENHIIQVWSAEHGTGIPKELQDLTDAKRAYKAAIQANDPIAKKEAVDQLVALRASPKTRQMIDKWKNVGSAEHLFSQVHPAKQAEIMLSMNPEDLDKFWRYASRAGRHEYFIQRAKQPKEEKNPGLLQYAPNW